MPAGVADVVIPEPLGGAQRHREQAIEAVRDAIKTLLKDLKAKKPDVLRKERRQKYLDLGSKSLV